MALHEPPQELQPPPRHARYPTELAAPGVGVEVVQRFLVIALGHIVCSRGVVAPPLHEEFELHAETLTKSSFLSQISLYQLPLSPPRPNQTPLNPMQQEPPWGQKSCPPIATLLLAGLQVANRLKMGLSL
jgi:hypothetical protein